MGNKKVVEGEIVTPRIGRPPKFVTAEDLLLTFYSWKEEFEPGGRYQTDIPDIEGFCDYIDSYRDLFSEYDTKPEFSDTIKRIKNWIYYKKKQLAMQNKMNATVFIFDAKNNHGYVDQTESKQTVQVVQPIVGGLAKAELGEGDDDSQDD